jgi:hypothetical protein
MSNSIPPGAINAFSFGPYLARAVIASETAVQLLKQVLSFVQQALYVAGTDQAALAKLQESLANLEKTMAEDFTAFNQAVADLQTEVGQIATQMDTLFADLTAALGSGNQAAVDAATAAIQSRINDLKAAAARDMPPAPSPPPGP